MYYPLEITGDNTPVIGIGGGSYTKRFQYRIVMRKTGDRYTLKPAYFIRDTGDLSCQLDQGYVKAEPGDIIVKGYGLLPIDPKNPKNEIEAEVITAIEGDRAITASCNTIRFKDIPGCVFIGAAIYHNRDGSYFAGGLS